MYAAEANNKKFTFHVSGLLWNRSLVMRDMETGSLWSHLLGKCVKGEMYPTQLIILPSVLTDWGTWKKNHPKTTVMLESNTHRGEFKKSFYKNKANFGAGTVVDGKSKIWSLSGLEKQPLLNESFAGREFVIWFDSDSSGVWAWQTDVEFAEQSLQFEQKGDKIIDKQTGSHWNLMLGFATEGPLKDKMLKPEILIPTFQHSWRKFHPKTEIWPVPDDYDPENDDTIPKGGGATVN